MAGMDPTAFFARYGEAARVPRHAEDGPEAVVPHPHRLHERRARQISEVVDQALRANATLIRPRELPPSCLVRLVCDSGPVSPAGAAPQQADRSDSGPGLGENVFQRDGQA
jgi:hypothetical protein